MTKGAIKGILRATIFGGAVALLPAVASADEYGGETTKAVPDYAQAEARGADAATPPTVEERAEVPDHAQAEARGAAGTTTSAAESAAQAPDHAQVENRGAVDAD